MAVLRMKRPMRVTRGSSSTACTAPTPDSASVRIERNFNAVEVPAAEADALLRVEDRTAVLELDRQAEEHPERRREQQPDAGERHVKRTFHACANPQKVSHKTEPSVTSSSRGSRRISFSPTSTSQLAAHRDEAVGHRRIENSVRARASPSAPRRDASAGSAASRAIAARSAPTSPDGHDEPGCVDPGHAGRERRADHGLAAGHRLELHVAERLGARHRGQHEHVARDEERAQLLVVHLSGKAEARRPGLAAGERAPLFPHRSIARNHHLHREGRGGVDQHAARLCRARAGRRRARSGRPPLAESRPPAAGRRRSDATRPRRCRME